MARQMFEHAIELDSGYASAYAGLADVHAWFYQWWGGTDLDYDAADRASRRALDLAPSLSEAHGSRGFVLSLRSQYEDAAREFEEAIRLNPQSFDAHYLYARTLFSWGRIERSAEMFRRASELRSEDFQSVMLLGQSLRVIGHAAESLEATREGIRRAERQLELDPNDVRALSLGCTSLLEINQMDRAIHWAERALELDPDDGAVLINTACLYARLGMKEKALELLEKTFARGWGKRDWIEHDPDYDSLRDEPRFQAMLQKLK
jgi:adenylate cyclase